MTHDEFAQSLGDLLDRALDDATVEAMDDHASKCAECAALRDDFLRIEAAAAALPALTPSRDLWSGIAERIDAPVTPLVQRDARVVPMRRWWTRPAAIAAGAMLVVGSLSYLLGRVHGRQAAEAVGTTTVASVTPAPDDNAVPNDALPDDNGPKDSTAKSRTVRPPHGAPAGAPANAPTNKAHLPPIRRAPQEILQFDRDHYASGEASGEQTYDTEIARLHKLMRSRRGQMDSTTVAVLEKNLKVIDDAIAQCRAALARDPNSRFLVEALNGALDTKVQLLRTAAMLPVRT